MKKRVVITGASRGIGERLAHHFARFGADIFIIARNEILLRKVIDQCKTYGPKGARHHYMTADLADASAAKRVIKSAEDTLGGIDYLVLNHAMIPSLEPWRKQEVDLSSLRYVMDVNFMSAVHLTSYAMPALEKSGGCITVVGSVVGKVAAPFMVPYSASKFALDGFFNGLRQEFKIYGKDVSVTQAVLGVIDTGTTRVKTSRRLGFIQELQLMGNPDRAALHILLGTAKRKRELHYPKWQGIYVAQLLRDWLPETVDYVIRSLYKYE